MSSFENFSRCTKPLKISGKGTKHIKHCLISFAHSMAKTQYTHMSRADRNTGFTKHGSAAAGTHAAHKCSHRVATAVLQHTPGRHVTTGSKDLVRSLNQDSNLRMKTAHGNQVHDERHDKRIVTAIQTHSNITDLATAKRASQSYKGSSASTNKTLSNVGTFIGDMQYNNSNGRPVKIKNM